MNAERQLRAIDLLIKSDEAKVSVLVDKIAAAASAAVLTEQERTQLESWREASVVLRLGLEGLRLKHDSLTELITERRYLLPLLELAGG